MERIGSIILKYNAFILSSVKIILFVEGKKIFSSNIEFKVSIICKAKSHNIFGKFHLKKIGSIETKFPFGKKSMDHHRPK